MSEDELIVSIVSMGLAGLAWPRYYVSGRQVRHFARSNGARWIVDIAPVIAAAALFAVLKTLAAHDVRDDTAYLGLYFLLGAAWVAIALWLLPLVGVSLRDDVVERRNPSAAYVVAGAVLGLTFAYAGGNIGDGPGWWVVVFSAALATTALFVVWLILDASTGVADVVTIDRDPAAGLRLAGFLVASGLIFGRAVAGDWVSAEATLMDFARMAWPAIALLVMAAIVERAAHPSVEHPVPSTMALGVIPGLAYVAIALIPIVYFGLPA